MRIRRAVAAAAATAVIAPAALLAASAAHATENTEPPSASESAEPTPDTTEATDEETSAPETPAEETEGEDKTAPEETAPADENSESEAPANERDKDEEKDKEDEKEGEGEKDGSRPFECEVDEDGDEVYQISDDLKTSLTGLPDAVVAGSGWNTFQLQMHNTGKSAIDGVSPFVAVWAENEEDVFFEEFALQAYDTASGKWQVVSDGIGAGGYFTQVSLKAGEKRTFQLRLKVDAEVPYSLGIAVGAGEYSTADGGCWVSHDDNGWVYLFEVLEEGAKPGKPGEAKPKPQTGGKKPIEADKVSEVKVTGELAATGSDSNLPMFALAGAAAVALGAGAMFVVRRRRNDDADATAAA
ncbi:LAETG motif-containing sortase-dependent surface protein [Streptomyces sp. 549]|uniref:LAETG motif-containing sortase-dependent surface protein n=1 Tax=Streptomyces sp. 549 TaxID=3049076 RepID=UPI0024C21AC0|nr:LAETG motif-containing sortase-dependent surface protein [Streptomyces sp. 549]MDK1472813.1 LAETG motif-containing sortase-dependent surface protein [Streptomyces sp. 549]